MNISFNDYGKDFEEKMFKPSCSRGVWDRKTRVDEVRSLDILDLQREGIFSQNFPLRWTTRWSSNGIVVASVSYIVESHEYGPSGLRFIYTITDGESGEKRDYNYVVPVVNTACHFGGKRWWFVCPLIANGRACKRRCRIIYIPPGAGYFGCRQCHNLTYESRQRHREKFYEYFEKPYKVVVDVRQELVKTRSLKKKARILEKMSNAHAAIEKYGNDLFSRKSMTNQIKGRRKP